MAGKRKKVILVTGKGSSWYEQAIFIVNEGCSSLPADMVKEAENIIKRYIASGGGKEEPFSAYKKNMPENNAKLKKEKTKTNSLSVNHIINFALIMCMVLVGFLIYMVFKL